ncbi:DUF2750 domain-containing protein [Bowmanella dokdonensis]|uniref:DUF2750 domain-containing protein n=1 Tax=Bowmanella dokdonensis TaxID=751969 RepID=A0A939IMC3_9ALTE|nr:DUF2750 domain-containing protein [Bowmanella dokdonensis]MBN7825163.1 DUF2750 domain-containing protein [Bowmanella dokdonensis]
MPATSLSPESLLTASAEERAEYCFMQAVNQQLVWGLEAEHGWVMLSAEGDACTPLFPDAQTAALWSATQYPQARPKPIKLDELLSRWFVLWQPDEVMLMLFPVANEEEGILVQTEEFTQALKEEQGGQ